MNALKRHLFDAYNGFADKRIKDLSKCDRFIVDDRTDDDIASNGKLYGYFCMMFATVISENEIELSLVGNIPESPRVREWITENAAKEDSSYQHRLEITVTPRNTRALTELAKRVAAITARGAPRYSVPSYKYVCPRVARSLNKLATTLAKYWTSRA